MADQLPLKSVVLFIASGTMMFIIVFIFAKRQITRFALKSRGPHQPIGADAPKSLKQEIERRLKRTMDIKYEPKLLKKSTSTTDEMLNTNLDAESCHFFYRMKAMDALYILDEELEKYSVNIKRQKGGHSLRSLLLELRQDGPLAGLNVSTVEKFTEAYDHARHDPEEFLLPEYQEYMGLLNEIIEHIRNKLKDKRRQPSEDDVKKNEGKEINNDNNLIQKGDRTDVTYRPLEKRGMGLMSADSSGGNVSLTASVASKSETVL